MYPARMSDWNAESAEWYASKYGEYATNRLAIDALTENPSSILDVGCGAGAALRHAHSRWPAARLVGVDPVPRMIEIAEERLVGHPAVVELSVASAEALPFDDAAFDLVLAFDSFDHWQDKSKGALELARVLAGKLVVVKDQGVPGDDDTVRTFTDAGLVLTREEQIDDEDVSFKMWVFAYRLRV